MTKKPSTSSKVNLGGRPLRYTEGYINELADGLIEWSKRPDTLYFKRFCLENNMPSQEISDLCNRSSRFSEAVKFATDMQEIKLVEGAINKSFSHNMSQFVLFNKHGWRTKEKEEQASDTEKEAVSAVIKHLADAVKAKS